MQQTFLSCLCCVFVAHRASATTAIAWAASAAGVSLAQHAPGGNGASRALFALDTNGDGIVSPTEVASFAMSQGLDARQASQEFQTMDSNADGTLDTKEIAAALGNTATESDQTRAAPATPGLAEVAFPQQQQQQDQVPKNYVAYAPAQVSTQGTRAARAAMSATAAIPASTNASPQSFLEMRTSAKQAANEVVKQLSLVAKEEAKAEAFDSRSIKLRANASKIERTVSEQALQAGVQAARKVAEQLVDQISKLEHQAKDDEVEAGKLRAKSHADILYADQMTAVEVSAFKK